MAASPRVSEGSELGSYRILRKLGEGGMGAVFEAEHTSIGRHAAIKVLHPEHAVRTDVVQRFFNEARAVNKIDHPALVQTWDFGQAADGTAYIVMEFLRGEPLSKKLKRQGKVPVAEALDIVRQIASALAAVHEKAIVHRDLKPDNVVLVPNADGSGRMLPKLLDFGIAKLLEGKQAGDVQTNTDAVLGTPAYMSPEQCRGANKVDGRADVYSLGVMLYEMLAGRRPFIADGSGAVFGMHMYEEPSPIREYAPELPEPVAVFVHRLLIKDRNLRPTSNEVMLLAQQLSEGGQDVFPEALRNPSPSLPPSGGSVPSLPPNGGTAPSLPPSVGTAPSDPTTLGSSVGENGQARQNERMRRRQLVIGAGLLGAVTLMGGALSLKDRWQRPAPAPPTPSAAGADKGAVAAPRAVLFSIVSEPPGAEVVDKSTGTVLGPTPLSHKQQAAPGQVVLVLRHPGYQSMEVVLDGESNHQVERRLQPAARSPGRAAAPKTGAATLATRRAAAKAASSPSARLDTPRAPQPAPKPNFKDVLEK